jgi:hypothetical protein
MAGAARADATTVVMQFNIVCERHLKNALPGFDVLQQHRLQARLLKIEFNCVHQPVFRLQK